MTPRERMRALNATRLNAWEEGKDLLERATGREMTAEERQTWNRISNHMTDLDGEIRQLATEMERDQLSDQLREGHLQLFGEARAAGTPPGDRSLRRWLAGANDPTQPRSLNIDLRGALKERELVRSGASPSELRNAMQWDSTSGSLVVPTSMAHAVVEKLEESIAAFRMGCTQLVTTSGENLKLPTVSTHAVGTQVSGQGVAFAGTDPVFGSVDLNTYKYGQLVAVSSELIEDSAVDIAAWLGRDLGYALGRVVDADLIAGTGSGEPTGFSILAGSGTNTPIKSGGSLIFPPIEKWVDLAYSVNDAARENAVWLLRDSVAGSLRKIRADAGGTTGQFMWQPSAIAGQPDLFLGHPVFTDVNCAAAGSDARLATFGDPREYVVRLVNGVQIDRSDDVYFASDQVALRSRLRVGGAHGQRSHLNEMRMNA